MDKGIREKLWGALPDAVWHSTAPGRVNLLGEHVDYNDGPVLPAAIDRTVQLAAKLRQDRRVVIRALDLDEDVVFDLDQLEEKVDITGQPLPDWACYPAGVAWAYQKHDHAVCGLDVVFSSDVPMGAGLSSSAAVEMVFAALWSAAGALKVDRMAMTKLSWEAETQYIGLNCGMMDQFASAHGVAGHALYFDTRNLDWSSIPLPQDSAIVIANSGVRRALTESAYNDRFSACQEAVRLLQERLPGIRALRDVTPSVLRINAEILPELIHKRARHVVEECVRVEKAVELLRSGDAAGFGELMFAGHASLQNDYEVSCPELDELVEIASGLEGCWGARLTGAGFGGCTVNLVQQEKTAGFIRQLREYYQKSTGISAEVYLCQASRGAEARLWSSQ